MSVPRDVLTLTESRTLSGIFDFFFSFQSWLECRCQLGCSPSDNGTGCVNKRSCTPDKKHPDSYIFQFNICIHIYLITRFNTHTHQSVCVCLISRALWSHVRTCSETQIQNTYVSVNFC